MFDPELFVNICLLELYKIFDNILYKLRFQYTNVIPYDTTH